MVAPDSANQRQTAEYRARSAGRQLGAKILELLVEKPAFDLPSTFVPSLQFFLLSSRDPVIVTIAFSDFHSSEFKYTALEPARKGPSKRSAICVVACC
jgi:hypothetical protein